MVATLNILTRNQVIAYVGQRAAQFGVDPAAVLAVANHEGLNTAPGSTWILPGEGGKISFGPPSWFAGGAGSGFLAKFGSPAAAWTPDGIDYWLQQLAQSARGLTGVDAIRAIVTGFERPRADLVASEITNAQRDYAMFQQAIGTVQVPTLPGQAQPPAEQTPTPAEAQPSTTVSVDPGMLKLGKVGPLDIGAPSGLLLGLLAIVLLVIGAIVMNGRENNIQILQAAAMA